MNRHPNLLNRLPKGGMGRSLLLSGGILLLPLLMLFSQTLWERKSEIDTLQQQQQILGWISPLYSALDQATQYRGLREISIHYPGHYDFAEEHLTTLEQQLDTQLEQLKNLQEKLPTSLASTQEIERSLHRIEALWLQQQGDEFSFIEMGNLVKHINHTIAQLLPERSGHQHILLQDIPSLREVMAQLRGAGSGYIARAASDNHNVVREDEEDLLLQRIERTLWDSENQFIRLRLSLEDEGDNLNERTLSILGELVNQIQGVRDLVKWELVDAAIISLSPEGFFEDASEPIYLLHLLATDLHQLIQQELKETINQKITESIFLVIVLLLALILSILLAFLQLRRVVLGLHTAAHQLQAIGAGNFEEQIDIAHNQGEVTALLESIQETQTRLKESYTQLESARRFSESLTSSMEDGVYALDQDGMLIFINRAAETLLGYHHTALLGKNFHDIIHARHPDGTVISAADCPTHKSIAQGKSYYTDQDWFKHHDGHFLPVELSATPLTTDNSTSGSVAVFRDISKRIEMEQQLRTALEDAQQASISKDEFLASMSHELRTPLTSIIGNCELLAEQEHDDRNSALVQSIESAGRRQLALVNDILDLSKIESGKFTIEETPYDPNILLQDLQQMFALRMQDSGLHFAIKQQRPFTHLLVGDIQRSGQILINLIGNAVKFTEQGSITLSSWVSEQQLYFSVKDSGIGMPPEVVDRLFKRFEQADSSISRRFGGSGLGLYISFHLAQLMGGTVTVESEEGQGSTFTLRLPYRPGKPLNSPQQKPSTQKRTTKIQLQGTVLVAEDTPELQLLERRILESMGLTVTTANNGIEAVAREAEQPFDLILMDMQMPEMDGIEATQQIRARNSEIPIIALTANVLQKHRDAFDAVGGSGFIGKPIDRQELQQTLTRFIGT
ncbi:MAG: response regulator [Gammaproteobacteria bacterium]|nr:response regulator [Gammaproteobacteria bacterium]